MSRKKTIIFKSGDDIAAAEAQIVEQSKRIEFYLTEYSVELLANKMNTGEFIVPAYQREYTWEDERKSRFIESLILGLPIPFLFFWEMPNGKLEIVDGSQRLRAIEEFVKGDFRLGQLDGLTMLSGFTYGELPDSRKRKILNRSIRGIVLNEHADEQARFDMFERINTGSKIANTAEVRRGALAGGFMDLITELAKEEYFTELAPVSAKELKERAHEELVTRFFAYGDGLDGYRDRPSEFLFNYVKRMNVEVSNDPGKLQYYRDSFRSVMHFVGEHFPYGFRRSARGKATPRTRFESIAIGSKLALESAGPGGLGAPDVLGWIEGDEFSNIISSDGANAIARLRDRIGYVRDKLIAG